MDGLAVFGFGFLALLIQLLRTAYFHAPLYELKRQATRDKEQIRRLLAVARYNSAAPFLWLLQLVFAVLSVTSLNKNEGTIKTLVWVLFLLGLFKFFSLKKFSLSVWLAALISPTLAWLLRQIEIVTKNLKLILPKKRFNKFTHKHFPQRTDIYEKEDFQELIKKQLKAVNNRIPAQELEAALHAMDITVRKIEDLMVKKRHIHFVTTKDPIGPILLSELHKSGFRCFPVRGNSENEVVGMLSLQKVVEHTSGGVVGDAMDSKVCYVRADQDLEHVLQAFAKTGSSMFMAVNSEAEIVGLITVNDVLEQIVGEAALYTDFEDYGDPKRVAEFQDGAQED